MRIERSFGFARRCAPARPSVRALAAAVVSLAVALPAPAAAASPQESGEEAVAEPQAAAQPPAAADPGADIDRAQATMGRLLEVGRALHSWARDTRLERGKRQPTGRLPKQMRWDRCPGIGHSEIVALLVPAYLREVPEEDAWGRPLQFCLDRRLGATNQQYGVRSAGTDGTWENDPYEVGGFPENRLAGDLVWMDGYFVRWPEPQ